MCAHKDVYFSYQITATEGRDGGRVSQSTRKPIYLKLHKQKKIGEIMDKFNIYIKLMYYGANSGQKIHTKLVPVNFLVD